MTSDLKSATLITPVSMCILPPRASNGLRGHCHLQTVRSDLKIKLSDLNYICYHTFLASNGLHSINERTQLSFIDQR